MKISDGISNAYLMTAGGKTSATASGGSLQSVGEAGQSKQQPTVSVGTGASTASLSSALWLSFSDKAGGETAASAVLAKNRDVADEFLTWAKMTPAEKIRAQILEKKNLTEEGLAALPPEERKAIEAEIEQATKERLGFEKDGSASSAATQSAASSSTTRPGT